MDALTLAQLKVFLAVAETGGFAAAARKLGRAQSAVTYQIRNLERETGVALFDRQTYRAGLTEAGRALLPRAQRIVEDLTAFRAQAQGMARGLEAELTLVVEAMFPMDELLGALTEFQALFPSVQTRVRVETLGAAVEAVLDGPGDMGLVISFAERIDELAGSPVTEVELVAVAAPAPRGPDRRPAGYRNPEGSCPAGPDRPVHPDPGPGSRRGGPADLAAGGPGRQARRCSWPAWDGQHAPAHGRCRSG